MITTSIRSQIQGNIWRTYLLMAGFSIFIVFIAYFFGQVLGYGDSWVWIGLVFALVSNLTSYFWGDKIVLAMSHARPADRRTDFDFFTVAENLSIAAGLPMPKLYVIDDTALNAFATGRDPKHAVVCATSGLLTRLDRAELEGVISHELSHVKNYDIRMMLVVSVLVGTVAFMADMFLRTLWWGGGRRRSRDEGQLGSILMLVGIVLAILTPIIASLIQLAVSRRRELLADASGVLLTRNPDGLIRALSKLSGDKEVLEAATNATAHLYIVNPFHGKDFKAWFSNLFNTHPPIEERIARLRAM
jgi:heat shock protein HtpX